MLTTCICHSRDQRFNCRVHQNISRHYHSTLHSPTRLRGFSVCPAFWYSGLLQGPHQLDWSHSVCLCHPLCICVLHPVQLSSGVAVAGGCGCRVSSLDFPDLLPRKDFFHRYTVAYGMVLDSVYEILLKVSYSNILPTWKWNDYSYRGYPAWPYRNFSIIIFWWLVWI